VDIRAAGTNPAEYKTYSGAFGLDPTKLPIRLGFEAAGVVVAVGEDAHGPAGPVHVGDEVIAYRVQGAYASEIVVPASAVLPKPPTLSFDQASALMFTWPTAFHALTATSVGDGDSVVVHGGAGAVGLMVVQLAVIAGDRVIAIAGPASHAYLRELGAEPVVYGDGLTAPITALAGNGVDAAIDTVGSDEAIDTSVALVADRGRIATIAAFQRGSQLGLRVLGGGPGADPGATPTARSSSTPEPNNATFEQPNNRIDPNVLLNINERTRRAVLAHIYVGVPINASLPLAATVTPLPSAGLV